MRHWWRPSQLILLSVIAAGCGESEPELHAGGNSNWLLRCSGDQQCAGANACQCGGCSITCSSDDDCVGLENSRCALDEDPALAAACAVESAPPSGLCVPRCAPGECQTGQFCVAGGCVLAPMPEGDFCAAVADSNESDRMREEELLRDYTDLRVAGGITCGTGETSAPLPPLRFDVRLQCAARVLAADLSDNPGGGFVDSAERTTRERLALAGYTAASWGEAFAPRASPSEALNVMLDDEVACQQLTAVQHRAVGVGSVGGVMVISLGSD